MHDICVKEKEIATIAEQVQAIFRRIDEQSQLAKSVHELVIEMKYMREDMQAVKKDVEEMKTKPARQWQWLTGAVGGAIVTAVMALILKAVGLI